MHPSQQESFEVVSGLLGIRVNGHQQVLQVGEKLVVPPGTPHAIWRAGEDETHLLVEFRPARQTEDFFETMFALARDGKTNAQGNPSVLQRQALACPSHQRWSNSAISRACGDGRWSSETAIVWSTASVPVHLSGRGVRVVQSAGKTDASRDLVILAKDRRIKV